MDIEICRYSGVKRPDRLPRVLVKDVESDVIYRRAIENSLEKVVSCTISLWPGASSIIYSAIRGHSEEKVDSVCVCVCLFMCAIR